MTSVSFVSRRMLRILTDASTEERVHETRICLDDSFLLLCWCADLDANSGYSESVKLGK
jgi:hypothetical protein